MCSVWFRRWRRLWMFCKAEIGERCLLYFRRQSSIDSILQSLSPVLTNSSMQYQFEQTQSSFIIPNQTDYIGLSWSSLTHQLFCQIVRSLRNHRLFHAAFSLRLSFGIISAKLPPLCSPLTRRVVRTSRYYLFSHPSIFDEVILISFFIHARFCFTIVILLKRLLKHHLPPVSSNRSFLNQFV